MSGVLNPVGPEPPGTYWVRRVLVVGAVALVVVILMSLMANGSSGQQVAPAAQESVTPVVTLSPSSPSPTTPRLAVSARSVTTSAPKTAASPRSPATASTPTTRSTSTTQASTKTSTSPARPPAKATLQECEPSRLRPTLTGPQRLKLKQEATFALSLINGASRACTVTVTQKNFELTIFSGNDRIWTSADCSRSAKPVKATLASEKSVEWAMKWNGLRSAKNCTSRAEIPKPGTYIATAQLSGATPVGLRMVLRG